MIATLITRTREAASYAAGILTTIIGGLSLNDMAVIVGIGCTIGTFAVNWYYKRQENKREQERHNLEMKNYDQQNAKTPDSVGSGGWGNSNCCRDD